MDSHLEHEAHFTEGVSLQILCRDQAEVDHYWTRLSERGEESQCGWLKDRFGVSWQVVPFRLLELLGDGAVDAPGYERVFEALLPMRKIDIAVLEAAYRSAT
jgi:predicted 3-demethylubiquinone-9 3-methyltransferase (glyoxalase superfamily)